MNTSIGVLEKNYSIDRLNTKKETNHQFDSDTDSSEIDSEHIGADDITVYSTHNTEESSTLLFHVYNDDYIYVHHDYIGRNMMLDSTTVTYNNRQFVALATTGKNVEMIDVAFKNSDSADIELVGHDDSLLSIKSYKSTLFSTSKDQNMIEWDMTRLCPAKSVKCAIEPRKFDISDDYVVVGDKSIHLTNNNSEVKLAPGREVECLKVENANLFVGDSEGDFSLFDLRNFKEPVFVKQLHKKAISSFDFSNKYLLTCSFDKQISVWDKKSYENVVTKESSCFVSSLKVCDYFGDICFYGGKSTQLRYILLDTLTAKRN